MSKTSWLVKLEKCPYCDKDLNISSLSTRSEKDSIGNVIQMSKDHTEKCRGSKDKKLGNIRVKVESMTPMKTKLTTFEYQKILI